MKKIIFFTLFLGLASLLAKDGLNEITDSLGRKVVLPKKIERIITLGGVPVLNGLLMSMNEASKIISALPPWASQPAWKYQLIFAPQLATNESMEAPGQAIDIEKIIKAKPDVVFILQFHKSMLKLLEPRGIKTVVLKWDDTSDVSKTMKILGEIFDKKSVALDYIRYFKEQEKKALKITANIPKRVRVLYTRFDFMIVPVKISWWWIKTAGAINVVPKSPTRVHFDAEQLLAWNPDIIITNMYKGLKMLRADKRFANIKALKTNRTFTPPIGAMIWGQPTVEQPLMVFWALNKFYPSLYSEKELKKEMTYFYSHFFKVNLSKAQIDELLSDKTYRMF